MKSKTKFRLQVRKVTPNALAQRGRRKVLKERAINAGYSSWEQYCTSVINGDVEIEKRGMSK